VTPAIASPSMNIVLTTTIVADYKSLCVFVCFFNTPSHKEAHVTCRMILHVAFSYLSTKQEKSEPLKGACDTAVIFL
jgi:hypothetical protein